MNGIDIKEHIRLAALGIRNPPALRTMVDFIDGNFTLFSAETERDPENSSHVTLQIKDAAGAVIYEFSTYGGGDQREVARWITEKLKKQQ
jgi:hypothetical protein